MFEHRKLPKAPRDAMKTCLRCGAPKDVYTEFYWFTSGGKSWPSGKCKICHGECQSEYRRKNAKKYAALAMAWRRRNPEKTKEISRKSAKNPIRKIQKKRYLATEQGYQKQKFYNKLRRSHRKLATTDRSHLVTGEWFKNQCELQEHKCIYCHHVKPLAVEHVQPITRGGKHICENIVGACTNCNSSKHDKTLMEWRPEFSLGVYDDRFLTVQTNV